eukprot:5924731-Karenia_brevis.AAC.1
MAKAPTEPVRQLKCSTEALKNHTPVKGWPLAYVEKILAKIAMEGVFAKKQYKIPLTLRDVREWYLRDT